MSDINNSPNIINNTNSCMPNSDDSLMKVYEYFELNKEILEKEYSYFECALMQVETKFNILNRQFSNYYDRNPIESIRSRLKSKDSLIRKINRYGLKLDLESIKEGINDIAGIRVVCSFIDDIYRIERDFLSQSDVVLPERKDYIQNPKASGYRSLHLIVEIPIFLKDGKKMVRVEVQMRTIAMDFWASLEHKIKYKFEGHAPDDIIDALIECSNMVSKLDKMMLTLNNEINSIKEQTNEN